MSSWSDAWRVAVHHRSIFAKLLLIMVGLAASLLMVVSAFFVYMSGPSFQRGIDPIFREYTRTLAESAPDLPRARELQQQLGIDTRYDGPVGSWSTSEHMPPADYVATGGLGHQPFPLLRTNFYVAPGPDGGSYVFAWSFGRPLQTAHTAMLVALLVVICSVIVITHVVINRMLQPLRRLSEGVTRLSAGELDVTLPRESRDEFDRLTDGFNRMVDRVRSMIQARDQLLLDVSHELRSPLTRLRVALELLPDNEHRAGIAADISEMERKISELLELERLRAGKGITPERCELIGLLREVAGRFAQVAPGVRFTVMPDELWLEIDREKIVTVFRNLLENACKYALPDSAPIEIDTTATQDAVIVRVRDDGAGIPKEFRDRVFEPFFRADPSRSKTTGGYGLGLSICKKIMEAHGGDIRLEDGDRRGATFVIAFPRENAQGRPEAAPQ